VNPPAAAGIAAGGVIALAAGISLLGGAASSKAAPDIGASAEPGSAGSGSHR
jgi:hypothetical protein